MGSMISNATSAVSSLPGLIIQRANPALYNLLTNGILQGRLDFDSSKGTCRDIADKMLDVAVAHDAAGRSGRDAEKVTPLLIRGDVGQL